MWVDTDAFTNGTDHESSKSNLVLFSIRSLFRRLGMRYLNTSLPLVEEHWVRCLPRPGHLNYPQRGYRRA